MKITNIECTVIYARRRGAFGKVVRTALGAASISEHAVVRVETDAGITGLGEICSVFEKKGRDYSTEIEQTLTQRLIGQDPFQISHLVTSMENLLPGSHPAHAAIDMALHDIVGKSLDTPVFNLLGGKVRERIALSYSIPFGTPDEMATFALERVEEGFRTVKVKIGQSHERDVEAVRRVREAVGGDIRVRVDANMSFTDIDTAINTIHAIEPFEPELLEQPVKPKELAAMARIRTGVKVPIMADESIWSPQDAMAVIEAGAADIANVYVAESGGIQNARRTFDVCELAGMPCMIGSMPELGIGTVAQIHLGVAMRNLKIDSDCCGALYHIDDVLHTPLRIEGGYAYAPQGAGLGIDLDEQAMRRLVVAPKAEGENQ